MEIEPSRGRFLDQNPGGIKALRAAQQFLDGDRHSQDKLVRRNFYVSKLRMIEKLKRAKEAAKQVEINIIDGRLEALERELGAIALSGSQSERKDLDAARKYLERQKEKEIWADYYARLFVQAYQELFCTGLLLTGTVPTKQEVELHVKNLHARKKGWDKQCAMKEFKDAPLGNTVTLSRIYEILGFKDHLKGAKRGPKKG